MGKILVSGSIVLYRSSTNVSRAITSFLNTSLPVKLFLIDNSPTDELKQLFGEFLKDDRVEYIFNNRNLGFGAAHNVVLRKIVKKSTYHLVLNPDVTFESQVLTSIYNYMENNTDVGLLMPKVLYPNGRIQHICKLIPSPSDLIFRRFLPSLLFKKQLNTYDLRFTGYNHLMEVPVLSGCFMFMRTSVLAKAGFFDERFFLYLEDTDLSRRFYMVAKNIYYPAVEIIHDHERGSYKNLKLLYIHSRSAIQYFNKWGWWADSEREQINEHVLHSLKSQKISRKSLKVKTA
jgi:GT2 family glycosyltransferase